ncbi:MAG TPA: OB-fold domain-containing protein [Acidimicrobiales bacterium]|nr:OB-fold domain-containing protein [Acidimicrobiales bacterium]
MGNETGPYLPADIATLFPDHVSQGFWERCARHELAFQRCSRCHAFRHPPAPICHVCRSSDVVWAPVEGRGRVYTYTIVTHPVHPALAHRGPFNIVLVEFPDAPGVRLVSNLVDTPPEAMATGLEVEVVWEEPRPGTVLPRFRRARPA